MIENYEQEMNRIRAYYRESKDNTYGEATFMNNASDLIDKMLNDAYMLGWTEREEQLKNNWISKNKVGRIT
jgi:hypothetical protein